MGAKRTTKTSDETAEFHGKLVSMNEALMLRSVRLHEIVEVVETSNAKLQKEIAMRRQVEAAIRLREKRYRSLFDLGPIAIYSCDASGVIQKFNRAAAELWGRKPRLGDTNERFCGSFRMLRPDGTIMPHVQCPMAEVLAGKKTSVRNAEVIIERRDGSQAIAVASIRPLKNKRGKITGAINCFFDVTEHKKAEKAQRRIAVLAATNRNLEQEIDRRRTVEKALKTSEQDQRRLLKESLDMRDQLRLLSRQLLLAQEEERKRISRDLHDVIAQTLTGIN